MNGNTPGPEVPATEVARDWHGLTQLTGLLRLNNPRQELHMQPGNSVH